MTRRETQQATPYRVGPAGWSYADWKGIVYPAGMDRHTHPLTYLSAWFDAVEINTSFYRPVAPKLAEGWVAGVAAAPNFRFTAKLWQRFTHERAEAWTEQDVAQVREGFAPLETSGRLGVVLAQFPWSFRRTRENRLWLARLLDAFAAYPMALEIRHASWDVPEVYEQLGERGVAFCNIDQPLFRQSLGASDQLTAPFGYVRLHGRNAGNWFREDATRDERYDYLYAPEELDPWLATIRRMGQRATNVYVVTNNHFRGQAVVNGLEIQAALGRPLPPLPESLVRAYPRLETVAK